MPKYTKVKRSMKMGLLSQPRVNNGVGNGYLLFCAGTKPQGFMNVKESFYH